MNPSLDVGDDPRCVRQNRTRCLTTLLPEGPRRVQTVVQVHGRAVHRVDAPLGAQETEGWWRGSSGDAMIATSSRVALATFHADCLPIYLIQPECGALGLIHAGWRGLVCGVIEATVFALRSAYGGRAEDLRAAIGPAIERDRYQVDGPVLAALRGRFSWWRDVLYPSDRGRARLDLTKAAIRVLEDCGLRPREMVTGAPGTGEHPGEFYSHRRDGTTGRGLALLYRRSRDR